MPPTPEDRYRRAEIRYSLLGFSEDILEIERLAAGGGIGPIGPEYERMFWTGSEWSTSPPTTNENGEDQK